MVGADDKKYFLYEIHRLSLQAACRRIVVSGQSNIQGRKIDIYTSLMIRLELAS